MDIGNMTMNEIKEIAAVAASLTGCKASKKTHSLVVGEKVFIRTVTMHYTGSVVEVNDLDVLLEDAAWIADSGRFATALKDGTLKEVEPFPENVSVFLGAIVDVSPWNHDLPREQK